MTVCPTAGSAGVSGCCMVRWTAALAKPAVAMATLNTRSPRERRVMTEAPPLLRLVTHRRLCPERRRQDTGTNHRRDRAQHEELTGVGHRDLHPAVAGSTG